MHKPNQSIYFDYAAASPVLPEVVAVMAPFWDTMFANPSSISTAGVSVARAVAQARADIASLLGTHSDEIIFTGSGTESTNLALMGIMSNFPDGHLIVSAIEHHAVLWPALTLRDQGFDVDILPVGSDGLVDPGLLAQTIRPTTRLVSMMLANNEIGTIQPIRALSKVIHHENRQRTKRGEERIYFHTDAAQAPSYLSINLSELGVDALSLNAAKIGGPKGVGLLAIRRLVPLRAQILGGGQEASRRSGTENVAGAIGLSTALQLAVARRGEEVIRLTQLRDRLWQGLLRALPDLKLNGDPQSRLPNNLNITVPGLEAEALVLYLDQDGLVVGTGAACSQQTLEPSHVLEAIGLGDKQAFETIRLTLGHGTTATEVDQALKLLIHRITWLRNKLVA